MCQNVSFSSAQFNQMVSEQAVNSVRLLEYYYKLSIRLNMLALSLSAILQHIENLDETLLELIHQNETVAKGKANNANASRQLSTHMGQQQLTYHTCPMNYSMHSLKKTADNWRAGPP